MPRVRKKLISVLDDYPPILSDSVELDRLKAIPQTEIRVYDTPHKNTLADRISDAHTAIVMHPSTAVRVEMIEGATKLRHIAIRGGVTDNVALRTATRLGIVVTNSPGGYAESMAEHALALTLALARRIPELNERVRLGEWPSGFLNQLAGKVMGIVGYSETGRRMAELCLGIGMSVLVCPTDEELVEINQEGVNQVTLDALLLAADVVSLHVEHLHQSVPIFDLKKFSSMKSTALFINTSWGSLVNEPHLVEALRNDTIAGAALDVFRQQPVNPRNALLGLPNVILSPQVAPNTVEAISQGLHTLVDNVQAFFDGRVQNRIVV